MQIRGATVLVTGASRGLGRQVALEMGRRGARVALAARSADALAAVAAEVTALGAEACPIAADVAVAADRERLVEEVEARLGAVDILVNNAGVPAEGALAAMSEAAVRSGMEVDLLAPMLLTRLVLPGMLERRRGHVVNVSSILGVIVAPAATVYSAAKSGLLGWSLSLRAELRGTGVHVTAVCPGFIDGEGMFADGASRSDLRLVRLSGVATTPATAARAVVRAVERERAQVTPAGPLGWSLRGLAVLPPALAERLVMLTPGGAMARRRLARSVGSLPG